jgi:hypothetical protein
MGAEAAAPQAARPDLGGWWFPANPFQQDTADLVRKLRPESAAIYREATAAGRRPEEDYGYCTPPSFSGAPPPARPRAFFELLFSPDRVTLLDGTGLVRRLYLRATPLPNALEESRSGTSIARWEGQTLVVETTGLYRRARPLLALQLGGNARVVERFTLKESDRLEVITTITAPDLFTAPAVRTEVYRRDRDYQLIELDLCDENDGSVDHATGKERFDTTPPDDLPPPPR